jgi:hypothetical protein
MANATSHVYSPLAMSRYGLWGHVTHQPCLPSLPACCPPPPRTHPPPATHTQCGLSIFLLFSLFLLTVCGSTGLKHNKQHCHDHSLLPSFEGCEVCRKQLQRHYNRPHHPPHITDHRQQPQPLPLPVAGHRTQRIHPNSPRHAMSPSAAQPTTTTTTTTATLTHTQTARTSQLAPQPTSHHKQQPMTAAPTAPDMPLKGGSWFNARVMHNVIFYHTHSHTHNKHNQCTR